MKWQCSMCGARYDTLRELDACECKYRILKENRMHLKPFHDYVLVRRLDAEEKTPGGLYIPDQAKDKPMKGKVVAVGPGKRLENGLRSEMCVKEGDVVMFTRYGGNEVQAHRGVGELLMIRADDLLGLVE